MVLSLDCILVFTLRDSGVKGTLTSGRIELGPDKTLTIYNPQGAVNEYLSGYRLRSWLVLSRGRPLPEWAHVLPEDAKTLEKR